MVCDGFGWFDNIDFRQMDFNAVEARHFVSNDVVIVEIDAASLKALNQWPWPRHYHAQVLSRLNKANVATVFYDVDFSALSNPEDDRQLAEALSGFAKSKIYLPAFVQPASSRHNAALIRSMPADRFRQYVTLAGVNIWPEEDGLVRRINTSLRIDGEKVLLAGVSMSGKAGAVSGPISIDYSIDPASFSRISFADVITGAYDRKQLQDKHVIVGATAVELGDILPVPVYHALPGPVVQAMAYQTLIEKPLVQLSTVWRQSLFVILALMMGVLQRYAGWRTSLAVVVSTAIVLLYGSFYLFGQWRITAGTIPYVILLVTAFGLNLITTLDRQRIKLLFQTFALRRKDALMASIVTYSHEGILTVTEDGIIESANPAAASLFGRATTELTAMAVREIVPSLFNDDNPVSVIRALADHAGTVRECEALHRDGKSFPVEVSASRIGDDSGTLCTLFVRDNTERLMQRRTLEHLATHDSLTGLANRYYLHQRLEQEIMQGDAPHMALLLIDLDKFKEINDTLGHVAGDELLRLVAERLTGLIDPQMILARIGGDEFSILLPDCDLRQDAMVIGRRIVKGMQPPFELQGTGMEIGASVGIAMLPEDADGPVSLIKNADTALYVAKNNHSGVCAYQADFTQQSSLRMTILTNLRQAISQSQLLMYYQPKMDIDSGVVSGLEALLRWHHPSLGLIPPDEIFDVAENTRMIWPLTQWTLTTAIRDLHCWRDKGYDLRVAVNLSARLLQDPDLVARIMDCVRAGNISPDWLTLEITESAILGNPERAMQNALALRAASIQLSIDDFGTGYSSLSYLRNLPADELKIDKSFVMDMLSNDNDTLIVKSTIDLAHNLGIKVVAEGIESTRILDKLAELGCDYAQGYHISKPIPFEDMNDWLAVHHNQTHQQPAMKGMEAGNSPVFNKQRPSNI